MSQVLPKDVPQTLRRWKRYPAYKDSGVEWLGEIPEHWKAIRLRRRCQLQQGLQIAQNERFSEPGDNRFEYITIKSINSGSTHVNNKEYIEKPPSSVICIPDEILLARTGATGEVISGQFGVFHNNFFKVNYNQKKILKDYLIYYLKSSQIKEHLLLLAGTTTIPDLNHGEFLDTPFFEPSIDEQKAIASFLDRETAKIDALIAKKERLIELLQEKRTAIISHAVSKGLDSTVPMKDSGVEWLDEIPEHWKVTKLGAKCSVKARLGWKGLKASEYVEDGYIFLSTPNIKEKDIDFENVNYITAERYFESPEIMLEIDDVLIAKDGSTLGIVNVVRSLPAPTTVNSSIAVIRHKQSFDSVFLYYFLASEYTQNVIQRMKDGMGVPHLFQADLRKFTILTPPIPEQKVIASYLDRETVKIDALITKIREGIEKLKEYRTALISAAVTGKIDVRNEVAS